MAKRHYVESQHLLPRGWKLRVSYRLKQPQAGLPACFSFALAETSRSALR
jgi:hypothetical protein